MLAEVLPHLPQEVRHHPLHGAGVGPLAPIHLLADLPRGVSALGGDVVDLAAAMQVGQQSLADQTLDCLVQLHRRLAATATAELLAVDEYLKTAIEGDGVQAEFMVRAKIASVCPFGHWCTAAFAWHFMAAETLYVPEPSPSLSLPPEPSP
jgi:hypothetical protein